MPSEMMHRRRSPVLAEPPTGREGAAVTACTVTAAMRAAARLDTAQRRKTAGRAARTLPWGIAGSDAAGLRAALLPMQQCWLACRVAAISAGAQCGPKNQQAAQHQCRAAPNVNESVPEDAPAAYAGDQSST